MKNTLPLFIIFSIFIPPSLFSQQFPKCGFDILTASMEKKYPGYKDAMNRQFDLVKTLQMPGSRSEVLHIPVVFHVVYNSNQQNISENLIYDQLEVLNMAFRNSHADVINTREPFKPLAGDAEIEFYLATTDPQGNPSSGITRTLSSEPYFGSFEMLLGVFDIDQIERLKYTAKGGFDGWPSDRYLNIWIADMGFELFGETFVTLLGLATPPRYPSLPDNWPPGSVDGIKDGVLLQYQTIGRNNPHQEDLFGLSSQARTAVHEIGHYFGLRHIDGDAGFDNCSASDGIDDTPVMVLSGQAAECPAATINTCESAVQGDLPDMWENYMDYSNDMCQTMFTKGQVAHMRSVLLAQRDSLLAARIELDAGSGILSVWPNPARDEINISLPHLSGDISIFNMAGNTVMNFNPGHYSPIDISGLIKGVYYMRARSGDKICYGKFLKQ